MSCEELPFEVIQTWKPEELKEFCRKRCLKVSGLKAELVAHVFAAAKMGIPIKPTLHAWIAATKKGRQNYSMQSGISVPDPLTQGKWEHNFLATDIPEWCNIVFLEWSPREGCWLPQTSPKWIQRREGVLFLWFWLVERYIISENHGWLRTLLFKSKMHSFHENIGYTAFCMDLCEQEWWLYRQCLQCQCMCCLVCIMEVDEREDKLVLICSAKCCFHSFTLLIWCCYMVEGTQPWN